MNPRRPDAVFELTGIAGLGAVVGISQENGDEQQ